MTSAGYDRSISMFSPEGRLLQVEYALKAVESSKINAIALQGSDSAVIVVGKDIEVSNRVRFPAKNSSASFQDKLADKASLTSIYRLSKTISCVAIGIEGLYHSVMEFARYHLPLFQETGATWRTRLARRRSTGSSSSARQCRWNCSRRRSAPSIRSTRRMPESASTESVSHVHTHPSHSRSHSFSAAAHLARRRQGAADRQGRPGRKRRVSFTTSKGMHMQFAYF